MGASKTTGARAGEGTGMKRGFTIVELMVAMALMVILTGVIIFIFAKSRDVTLYAEAQSQVFQNARYFMDLIAGDLANIIKTADMEPYEDTEQKNTRMYNGHFDRGEKTWDPLGGPHEDSQNGRYDYSLTLNEGTYDEVRGDREMVHSADRIYMKTVTADKGVPVEGFVTYYLDEVDQVRPILRRRFVRFDRVKRQFFPKPAREDDVCYFVTDFKIEFYHLDYRDSPKKRRGPGIWLTPKEASRMGILDPDARPATFVFNYHFDDRIQGEIDPNASGRGKILIDPNQGYRATFTTKKNFSFPQLVPGDKIFIYGIDKKIPPGNQIPWLVDQELTIAEISPTTRQVFFQENVVIGPQSNATPPASLSCSYRAAYLPAALRITIRVKDERADAIRTIQRVFRVMGG